MNSIIWVVAVIVLNAVIAGIAKKAQANAEAARRANAAGAGASGGIAGGASRGTQPTFAEGARRSKAGAHANCQGRSACRG